jgi:hypothetical protein
MICLVKVPTQYNKFSIGTFQCGSGDILLTTLEKMFTPDEQNKNGRWLGSNIRLLDHVP